MDTVEQFECELLEVYDELVSAKGDKVMTQHKSQELYNRLIVDDVTVTSLLSFETVTIMYDLAVELVDSDPLCESEYIKKRGENTYKFKGRYLENENPYQNGGLVIGSDKTAEIINFLCGKTKADWERNDMVNVPIKQQKQNTKRFAMALA